MELLGDMGLVESCFGPFGDIVLVSVEDRCTVCAKRTIGSDIVFNAVMVLLGDEAKWKLLLVRLEIVLILTQDRCAVCVKRTIGSEIFWTHLMELLGDLGHVKSHFGLLGDSVGVGAI